MAQSYSWKSQDSGPTNTTTLQDRDGNPVNLTGATVRFLMRKGDTVHIDAAAEIVDAAAGTVRYNRTAVDTGTVGVYQAEYEALFSNGNRQSYPEAGYITVRIIDDVA